jgi:hypothetical protein
MDKEIRKLIEAIVDAGFTVTVTRKGRYRVTTADGEFVTVITPTGGEGRGLANALAALKRRGFRWPKR